MVTPKMITFMMMVSRMLAMLDIVEPALFSRLYRPMSQYVARSFVDENNVAEIMREPSENTTS